MGRKSKLSRLSEDERAFIYGLLADERLTLDDIKKSIEERYPTKLESMPSRAALGRDREKLERRLNAIRTATQGAKIICAEAGDDKDARSESLTALVQTGLFEALVDIQDASEDEVDPIKRIELLSKAAKNIATLTRSSVNLKKFQAEAEENARRKLLEEQKAKFDAMASKGGVTEETKVAIRELMGIV